ncbi:hypothetical protein DUNSADRAFT_16273 [Dunaliella salina]|uniref:RRM domain-containing protein n=1 Tax=Dunaliella salina TaxID=3046 RepID=A0ABQ7G423_DUNSA|nr:hypothetical protein DUNSADRAFT_16273 [Dunaliella salina]|eukprot:KAF5829315.1 hypothetical protein DUNSADRAFT_16273 [Dunaliella salina]
MAEGVTQALEVPPLDFHSTNSNNKACARSASRSPVRSESPPRRSRRSPSDSPPRRRRSPSESPPRRRRSPSDSPPRRRRSPSDSPPRRRRSPSDSPPRRRRSYSPPPRGRYGRSRSPAGRAMYGLPPRREPPKYGLQMFVAGFNFLSSEREVERQFNKYGRVTEVRIVRDPMGKSKGFGFIAMDDPDDVQRAIRHMHGRDWEGRRLNVELCRQVA